MAKPIIVGQKKVCHCISLKCVIVILNVSFAVPPVRSFLGQAVTERSAPVVDFEPLMQTESTTDREEQVPAPLTELEPLREVAIELSSSTESALPEGVADSHLGEQEELPEVEGSPVERPQKRVRSDEARPSTAAPEIILGSSA